VLNFIDMPLAENYRRNKGLTFDQFMKVLDEFLKVPNWSVLTITEIKTLEMLLGMRSHQFLWDDKITNLGRF
jgi:hypothetical protein